MVFMTEDIPSKLVFKETLNTEGIFVWTNFSQEKMFTKLFLQS